MTINSDASSVSYSTHDGGSLVLKVKDNMVVVSTLQKMLISVVTPGQLIRILKEGDTLDFTVDPGITLFISAAADRDYLCLTAQDSLHFYNLGVLSASVELLPQESFEDQPKDLVNIGLDPQWIKNGWCQPFMQTDRPVSQFPDYFRLDVDELADLAVALITKKTPTPIKPTNRIANMNAFLSNSDFGPSTIVQYIQSVSKVTDISIPAFTYKQVSPVMLTVLGATAARLYNLNQPQFFIDLSFGQCLTGVGNCLHKLDKQVIKDVSEVIIGLYNLSSHFEYDKLQKKARQSLVFTTALFTYLNTTAPLAPWIWDVSEEVDKLFPLPSIASVLFDFDKGYVYETMLPLVKEYFEASIELIPNLMHRLRTHIQLYSMQAWARTAIEQLVVDFSASAFREKPDWASKDLSIYTYIDLIALPRFCNDLGLTPSTDASKFIAKSVINAGNTARFETAKFLTLKLVINNSDDNIYQILKWIPKYFSAYVHDNLCAVDVPNKLQPGVNPWTAKPCTDEILLLQSWMGMSGPTNRRFTISAFPNDGNYGISQQWFQLNKQNIAISFLAPWKGLDLYDLNTIITAGSETVAVQSGTDNTASVYISQCETCRIIFHFHTKNGECEFVANSAWKPLTMTLQVDPGDFIIILDSPEEPGNVAKRITESAKGVREVEDLIFILTSFMQKSADTLFTISDS